jgi:hypothetical protein
VVAVAAREEAAAREVVAAAARDEAAAARDVDNTGELLQEMKEQIIHSNIQRDDLEQYGRRMHIRIEGLEFKEDETPEQHFELIKTALQSVNVPLRTEDVVRFHRSSRPVQRDGKTVKQTIVKFARWEQRRQAQFANKRAREANKSFRIHGDLTRRRHGLLLKAREAIEAKFQRRADAPFAYADVNSNLRIRLGEECHNFNTNSELISIVEHFAGR